MSQSEWTHMFYAIFDYLVPSRRHHIKQPDSSQFNENFEKQFRSLSRCLEASTTSPPDHSLYSIYTPKGIEDWGAFAAALPDYSYPRYKMIIPKPQKILALDLDETLLHSTSKSSGECDFFVEVLVDRSSCLYYVFKRPHVDRFLETVRSWFHLVIYTASMREYADPVVNWLDAGRALFTKRLYRSACVEREPGVFSKNLSLVDSDPSRVILLDNSPASFLTQPDNGIPIETWTGDQNDTCLLDLLPLLDAIRFVDDVRTILSLRSISKAT